MSTESNAKIFSVIGGCRRSGRWLVPRETAMLTLFGRAVIDLREARTTADELEFTCTSVFANVTFIVPEGAEVRPSGTAIFGSFKSIVPVSTKGCELPPMSIEATTVFGRLRIRTTEEAPVEDESRRQRRRRRKADARRETQIGPDAAAAGTAVAPVAEATPEPAPAAEPAFLAVDTSQFDRPDSEPVAPARAPKDLSSPIEAFGQPSDADQSPLSAADVPTSLAGTVLDEADPAPAPTHPDDNGDGRNDAGEHQPGEPDPAIEADRAIPATGDELAAAES